MRIPSKEVRHRLSDQQWETALRGWRIWLSATTDGDLPAAGQAEALQFVLSYLQACELERGDVLSDNSRRVSTNVHLRRLVLQRLKVLTTGASDGALYEVNTWFLIARFYKADSDAVFDKLKAADVEHFDNTIRDGIVARLSQIAADARHDPIALQKRLVACLQESHELCQRTAIRVRLLELGFVEVLTDLLEATILEFDCRKALLRMVVDLAGTTQSSSFRSQLIDACGGRTGTIFSDNCQELLHLTEFLIDAAPHLVAQCQPLHEIWQRGTERKAKGKGKEQGHAAQSDLVLKLSEIQTLLPELGDGFLESCLNHYGGNVEETIAHLLDDDLPPFLRQMDKADASTAEADLRQVANPESADLAVERRNVYDNDAFDRLEHDPEAVMRKGKDRKVPDATHDMAFKNKIMSLAYDPDEDEVDDTYDEVDVKVPDQQLNEELTDDAAQGDLVEQALLLALETNEAVFGRQNRRTPARAQLRAQSKLSDEQIEGWKSMLDREPKRRAALLAKYEFSGDQETIGSTKWRAPTVERQDDASDARRSPATAQRRHQSGPGRNSDTAVSSASNDSRGRGRGRGRGRRGAHRGTSHASTSHQASGSGHPGKKPIDPQRRDRKNLREKKLARGVND